MDIAPDRGAVLLASISIKHANNAHHIAPAVNLTSNAPHVLLDSSWNLLNWKQGKVFKLVWRYVEMPEDLKMSVMMVIPKVGMVVQTSVKLRKGILVKVPQQLNQASAQNLC